MSEENPEDRTAVFESAVEIIKREALRETSDEEETRVTYYKENATPPEPEISPEVTKPELILTASVLEKTWIRVFVDGENPKEYIFNPGSNPVWRASEGFELLIGNAGGIELKLNGQEIKKLGSPGQVVHLNLPEGYIRKALED